MGIFKVLQNSSMYCHIERHGTKKYFPNNTHIIGDSAFPCQGVYSSISISLCRTRHISNGCCRTLQIFSILEYHAKNISRTRNIDEWSI
jgi:hypothetical protein